MTAKKSSAAPKATIGRPTEWTPELGEQILDKMTQGLSLAAAAAELDVHRQRVYEWAEKHPAFADTIALAKVKRQAFLERRLLSSKEGPVVTSTVFALKNAAAADWREKQEHEISGPDGGPIKTDNRFEIVLVRPRQDEG